MSEFTAIEQTENDFRHHATERSHDIAALLTNATALNRQTALLSAAWEKSSASASAPVHPDVAMLLEVRTYLARLVNLIEESSGLTDEVRDLLFEIKTVL